MPDRGVFRCLELAESAGRQGGLAPAWLNAGNEVAVAGFLEKRIAWSAIPDVVSETIQAFDGTPATDAASVVEAGRAGRVAESRLGSKGCMTQLRDPVRLPDREERPERDPGTKGNLARLVVTVCAVVALALVTHTTDLLVVIVALIVMIMLHELGHFVTAKWSGMKVTEYFLGFGPRLWSFRRGETEYGVKALPLGGYVKIIGMSNLKEVPPEDESRTYREQPFHNRLIVAVAGSAVHFILALLLIFTIFVGYGQAQTNKVQVQALTVWQGPPSPARAAGIQPGDVIVSINGHPVTNVDQVSDVTRVSAGHKCAEARRP